MKKALITGITGQDGSYLAELLLARGYEVWGVVRRSSTFNRDRVDHLHHDPARPGLPLHLVYGDLTDSARLLQIMEEARPDEVYNLGAQSHVRVSFDEPEYTCDTVAMGALRMLEATRRVVPKARYYQASSSEMFGKVAETPQTERTAFHPRSPYGVGKAFAYWQTVNYREAYGLFTSNGILFNHESPWRGETFVTRKITRSVGRIKAGLQEKLPLGNLDAQRDWGYAGDYVEAMWLMLQHDTPEDFVVATGETHTVREFLEIAFGHADLDYNDYVEIDPRYFRPSEVDILLGDASKARRLLGWEPKVSFRDLVIMMTAADLRLAGWEKQHTPGTTPPDAWWCEKSTPVRS
ncbi:GDP-mannose 4,6-dehydratase [Candidatus Poribacteria bacterium]|nr:GDP-mannose 4,6-dehydratase [Candidatus Poribacteria bacterium]